MPFYEAFVLISSCITLMYDEMAACEDCAYIYGEGPKTTILSPYECNVYSEAYRGMALYWDEMLSYVNG